MLRTVKTWNKLEYVRPVECENLLFEMIEALMYFFKSYKKINEEDAERDLIAIIFARNSSRSFVIIGRQIIPTTFYYLATH